MPETGNVSSTGTFRGFCLGVPKPEDYDIFKRLVAEVLPEHGCNTLVLLTRYAYRFESHPEVAEPDGLSPDQAAELARLCRANGLRLIPKMNLFGHQSGKKRGTELGLLRSHPELDETPEREEVRYCRSLCPRHPDVRGIVFDLADELVGAFGADAIHVGLDEVFEIGLCPRCRTSAPDEIFAEWVNALHEHFVGDKKLEMLMWGDRLLDGDATGYGEWDASRNGTSGAIGRIAKDILICDWHYGKRDDYPSIDIFMGQGFRMVVCPWKDVEAAEALIGLAKRKANDKLLGVLATSWCGSGEVARYLVERDESVSETARLVGDTFRRVMEIAP